MDCQQCGACCFSDSDSYVPLNEPDRERLGDNADQLVRSDGREHYMRMCNGGCIALAVRAGVFSCTIYPRRPEICRELVRGSPACREEYRLKKRRAQRFLDR